MRARGIFDVGFFAVLIPSTFVAYNVGRAQVPFTEEALARGIDYPIPFQFGDEYSFGEGVAFADLDGDWDADLIALGRGDGVVGVFVNNGSGYFTEPSGDSGIPSGFNHSGITAADYDGDRDLDLYLSNWLQPNLLLRNDGNFTFTDVTAAAGVGDGGPGAGCAWADYDGDGLLDLYLSNRTGTNYFFEENRLYHNLGNGAFEDVSAALGVQDPGHLTFQAVFFDMDWDADADLYLSTDKGYGTSGNQNHLFENVDGAFIEVTATSGTGAQIDSMGVAVGDFNNNGFQDIYCTNTSPGNLLLVNQGDGTFLEQSAQAGVESFTIGWGALFFDYDNNGFCDLYVCNNVAANRLYVHNGVWPCVDRAAALAVADTGFSYGAAAADIDNDGDLDLAVADSAGRILLYINHEGETRNWVRINVIGQGQNYFAVGARIAVRAGETWYNREISAGGSYKSQNELTAHFGLDSAEILDEVVITWPGGTTRTLLGLATNRMWFVVPPEALGDVNDDGVISLDDSGPFVAALLAPETDPFASAHADFNGNGIPDGGDIAAFVNALLAS